MKVKDVETMTKMNRTNIRFYEIEGFISPMRHKNGYRDYSEEDVETLKKIKFLRSLNISLEDIKFIHNHSIPLNVFLQEHIKTLQSEMENTENSIQLCKKMIEDNIEYNNLDISNYSNELILLENENQNCKTNAWKRLFARLLDMQFYCFIHLFNQALY